MFKNPFRGLYVLLIDKQMHHGSVFEMIKGHFRDTTHTNPKVRV